MYRFMCVILLIFFTVLSNAEAQRAGELVQGRGGMVVSACPEATRVGVDVLRGGGNAVDAAVAMGFALAVTYPSAGNIGGGSYLLIRMADGREAAIDARETAPAAAHRDMYLDETGEVVPEASTVGPLAAGVPGSVDGLLHALQRFGTLPRETILSHAVRLAREGFVPHPRLRRLVRINKAQLTRFPSTADVFFPDGNPLSNDEVWKQPDLASMLERISRDGRNGFYTGETARMLASAMRLDGGIITEQDLAGYRCIERAPLRGSYKGYDILGMPPSSSGGVALLQMLGVIERFNFSAHPRDDAMSAHIMVEAMRRAFADRAEHLGDPDFMRVSVDSLLSSATFDAFTASIDTGKSTSSRALKPHLLPTGDGGMHTTHFVVLDAAGNAVSVTTTINSSFGSLYVVPGSGMLLNNEMDDFSIKTGVANQFDLLGGEVNSIAPGKRMLSSMTPTIVLFDGKPVLLTGSPGGSKIITSVLQTVLNTLEFSMTLNDALASPRFHHQWFPDHVQYESGALSDITLRELRKKGHTLVRSPVFGRVEAIYIDAKSGSVQGCSDPRGYGQAASIER